MRTKNSVLLFISLILFSGGLIISLIFNGLVLWVNTEALSFWGYPESLAYDSTLTTRARISRLNCPVIITPGETGTIRLRVTNTQDKPITAWISTHLSMPGQLENMVRETSPVPLEPGEKSTLTYQVTTENTIFNRMVLARVFLRLSEIHPPSRTQNCGILAIELGRLSGTHILVAAVGSSLVMMGAGVYLWNHASSVKIKQENLMLKLMIGLSFFALVATIGSLFHIWLLGLIGFLMIPLVTFSVIGYYFGRLESRIN